MDKHIVTDGQLYIDTDLGTLTFIDTDSSLILRVTHLPTPIPDDVMIDLVAVHHITSYTPLQSGEQHAK